MRILEEIFIPSPPFIIERESSQDADIALKQQSRRSNDYKDLLKALDDNKEMKNELISHISNTNRDPNIQQSPDLGVIVHLHRVATSSPPIQSTSLSQSNSKACDACRMRKIRCDGVQPCSACLSRKDTCTFDMPVKKRGPNGKKKRALIRKLA
ncbi:MAG: hypothetical protein EZS28_018243, partial [Streblomastix strix]